MASADRRACYRNGLLLGGMDIYAFCIARQITNTFDATHLSADVVGHYFRVVFTLAHGPLMG
jgi:hypothetical protein